MISEAIKKAEGKAPVGLKLIMVLDDGTVEFFKAGYGTYTYYTGNPTMSKRIERKAKREIGKAWGLAQKWCYAWVDPKGVYHLKEKENDKE